MTDVTLRGAVTARARRMPCGRLTSVPYPARLRVFDAAGAERIRS